MQNSKMKFNQLSIFWIRGGCGHAKFKSEVQPTIINCLFSGLFFWWWWACKTQNMELNKLSIFWIRGGGHAKLTFAEISSRSSKSRFDQLKLEQNGLKKKLLTSEVARNSQKCTKCTSNFFQIPQKIKNMKKVCASRAGNNIKIHPQF